MASEEIESKIASLPNQPGVYLMKNVAGEIIYVGKAINLKNRVRQYFRGIHPGQPKVDAMVEHVASFDYVIVSNEMEAFMLECNLIKQHHPHYNILLRDDKHYPYIRVDFSQDYPVIEITRRMETRDKARYFGPYYSAAAIREAMDAVCKAFPLRTCRRDLPARIGKERPCLRAQMGACMAPCAGGVTPEEYHQVLRQACRFLEGHGEDVLSELRSQMQQASDELSFEKAALYRDRCAAVEKVMKSQQKAIITAREDWDVLGLYRGQGVTQLQIMTIRGGLLQGGETFRLEDMLDETDGELLRGWMMEYYSQQKLIPQWVLVPALPEDAQAVEDWLGELRQGKVYLHQPERGDKAQLVQLACRNARQNYEKALLASQREWERTNGASIALAEALGLPKVPHRIECYDISNTQGTNSVASMVVMEDGRAARGEYRRFRIKTVEGPNDFASMHEVITRRFAHGLADCENGEEGHFSKFPDLVIIDGGMEQLAFARRAMEEVGVAEIPAVGLAKREEWLYKPNDPEPVILPKTSAALHMVQRIRDEAHRFAITYHRSLRSTHAFLTELDGIPGIGPARRKAILKAFPIPQRIKEASLEEIRAVEGLPAGLAEAIYKHYHSQEV